MIENSSITVIVLLAIIILFLLGISYILLKNRVKSDDIGIAVTQAINNVWSNSKITENIGTIAAYALDIRNDYRKLDEMLRVPKERADLGEIALETILSDQLPREMFGIRERVLENKIPDAHIKSTVGIICIDSKFPLDNFRRMKETDDTRDSEVYKKAFLKDVRGHLQKIAKDYIVPEKGSSEFAFAYIHSESVYYFLLNEAAELLMEYARNNVQVVSPLTLSHKIVLIKAGVHAKRLSEQAQVVQEELYNLAKAFSIVDKQWKTFFTHFTNAQNIAVGDLDRAYNKLRVEFNRIRKGTRPESDSGMDAAKEQNNVTEGLVENAPTSVLDNN